jgi:hypothetical protein
MMSSALSDEEFVRAFESCELSPDLFHHRDHIRLARIYVDRLGAAAATERFRAAIIKFAAHLGISDKYHETITLAWMQLVIHTPEVDGEKLLDKKYIETFYSSELLATEAARARFVEPDRAALPLTNQTSRR